MDEILGREEAYKAIKESMVCFHRHQQLHQHSVANGTKCLTASEGNPVAILLALPGCLWSTCCCKPLGVHVCSLVHICISRRLLVCNLKTAVLLCCPFQVQQELCVCLSFQGCR